MDYNDFLEKKSQRADDGGFAPLFMPSFLFDFQAALVEWAVRKGRAAIFADCGLGKTPMQLVCAQNIVEKTNRPVLILTPLAVASQTCEEGEKFGIECYHGRDGQVRPGINVANYERLHYYDPADFAGVICDESSAIKAMSGQRRKDVTRFMSKHQYRFLFTATAAPNDYIELGTSSEALGYLGQRDMLGQFFRSLDDMHHAQNKYGDFWNTHKFVFRAHAETPFWQWVCSWARAMRRPSDLGFLDERFVLPELTTNQHVVSNPESFCGELFPRVAVTLKEQREERRLTIRQRCEKVLELVSHNRPAVVWCHSNEEGDLLEEMIPGCVQIAGRHSDEEKEESFAAFSHGQARVLVTKPKIGAWGLNWQHCDHMTFFPSHSFEQFYQGVRRCWRFGQKNPVTVDIVTTEGEAGVTGNLNRKAEAADQMFAALVREMNNALAISRAENHKSEMELPAWL